MIFTTRQIHFSIWKVKKHKGKRVKITKNGKKMSQTDLFEMEWREEANKNIIDINSLSLLQKIQKALGEKIFEEKSEGNSTDGPLTFIENLTNNLQTEFAETIGEGSEKKLLIRSLTKIFAILLSTRAKTVKKIKNIIKIAVKTAIRLWSGQN